MWRMYVQQHPRFGPWYNRIQKQPSWVVKIAVTAAVLTIAIPIALLTIAAVIVGIVAFVLLGLIAAIVGTIRSLFLGRGKTNSPDIQDGHNDGRQNVRILRH